MSQPQMLPPIASISSPHENSQSGNSSGGGGGRAPGPLNSGGGWNGLGSLRNGPLSPAMLGGPSQSGTPGGSGLPFDPSSFRTGLTPNESGIRTGLTPGNPNSMFPAPSPTTAALLGFVNGGPTPGTDEQSRSMNSSQVNDYFDHASSAAANGLFLLSQAQQQQHQQQQQQSHPQQPQMKNPQLASQRNQQLPESPSHAPRQPHGAQSSPTIKKENNATPVSGGRKQRGGKKKPSDAETDSGSAKRTRTNARSSASKRRQSPKSDNVDDFNNMDDDNDDDDEDDHGTGLGSQDTGADQGNNQNKNKPKTKAEADEDKRRNFLERNRQAALKCRQRKKQWLANLQAKVDFYGSENDALSAQITQLREEIVNLKTILLSHQDCSVARANGGIGIGMNGLQPGAAQAMPGPGGMPQQNTLGSHQHPGVDMQMRY